MRAAVIADDLTGAADTGAQLARAGYRTAVAFHGAPVPPADDLDAVVVDTDSRLLAPAAAAARVETVARALRRVPLLYKKVDSTLRGAVGAEVRAALDAAGRPRAIVAPAFPAAGRTTRGGVQHVDGRAVPGESDLAPLLANAGLAPVVVLARAEAADPHRVATALRDHACVIADAEEDADLTALVHAVADRADVLWVGSAGLAGALAAFRPGPRPPTSAVTATSVGEAAVLVAIGSDSPTAHAQVRRLASVPEVADVPLRLDLLADGREDDAIEQAVDAAAEALGASRPALVHVTATDIADGRPSGAAPTAAPDAGAAELARRIPPALAAVAERLAGDGRIDALVLSGGTTAVHVGRALGAHGLLVDGELEPGVPVGRLIGPRPFPVVTKAGGFGGETTLVHAVDALGGRLGARGGGKHDRRPSTRRPDRRPGGGDMTDRVVAVTMGDPAGIGPEIVSKAFADRGAERAVVVGDAGMLERAVRLLELPLTLNVVAHPRDARFAHGTIDVIATTELPTDLPFGVLDPQAGDAAYRYVRAAVELALGDQVHAIATAPLNKEAMHRAGHAYPGHTELLAELCGVEDYAMMLVTEDLRVVHVSTHVSLQEAIRRVAHDRELTVIRLADRSLRRLGVDRPRVAVAGLNPHAGESGLFGSEDAEVIAPAVRAAQDEGIDASGPWPPDTVFMQARQGRFDVVVVQYHDQGHIPIKLLGFDTGVNVTVGLPFFRTSVDHGTAFDIAGTGKADAASMRAALDLAADLARPED